MPEWPFTLLKVVLVDRCRSHAVVARRRSLLVDELSQGMTNVLWGISQFSEDLEKEEEERGCCTRVWGRSAQFWKHIIKDESLGGLIEYLGELAYHAKQEEFGFCSKCKWEISQTIECHLHLKTKTAVGGVGQQWVTWEHGERCTDILLAGAPGSCSSQTELIGFGMVRPISMGKH
ncbi:hypothetical protein M422DRAFT_246199 [Sphaerobolus stellatus SS14]|nr:hypothetical protein M422DRAFT_246199 [Sphaerobolus stellatus SS14]